jgi:hypothetical protein
MNRIAYLACSLVMAVAGKPALAQPSPMTPTPSTLMEPKPDQPLVVDHNELPGIPATTPRIWVSGEYVFWVNGTGKLVEMAKATYNSDQFNAILEAGGKDYRDFVETLLGNDRTGVRFGLGIWLNDEHTFALEASYLYGDRGPLIVPLGRRDLDPLGRLVPDGEITFERERRLGIDGGRIDRKLLALILLSKLGLPGITEDRREVVIPYGDRDLADGNITFEMADQNFWALDLIGRCHLYAESTVHVDGLLGYRHFYYQDRLAIHSEVTTLARPLLPGTFINSFDEVMTKNTYDGVFIGADLAANCGPWSFVIRPAVTIAYLQADVTRDGATTVTLPERTRLDFPGGTYLKNDDIGAFSTSGWTLLPEIGLRVTRSFGENVALVLGSTLLYFPEVAFAAPQLDLGLDPQRTLPNRPGTRLDRVVQPPELRSMFMTTMSAGLEFRF